MKITSVVRSDYKTRITETVEISSIYVEPMLNDTIFLSLSINYSYITLDYS